MKIVHVFFILWVVFFDCTIIKAEKKLNVIPEMKIEEEIFKLVNNYRKSIHKNILKKNNLMTEQARNHSYRMAKNLVPFSHEGFKKRIEKINKNGFLGTSYAENVAYTWQGANEAMKLWLNSPSHLKNIQGNFDITGIGVVKAKNGKYYFTQIFAKKK